MSKEFRIVKSDELLEVQRSEIDWSLCILCQKSSSEPLSQPWKGRGRGKCAAKGTGYHSFAINLVKFNEIGKVLLNVSPDQLNNGSGIEETLQEKKART